MMPVLEFIFRDFITWLGTAVLLGIIFSGIAGLWRK